MSDSHLPQGQKEPTQAQLDASANTLTELISQVKARSTSARAPLKIAFIPRKGEDFPRITMTSPRWLIKPSDSDAVALEKHDEMTEMVNTIGKSVLFLAEQYTPHAHPDLKMFRVKVVPKTGTITIDCPSTHNMLFGEDELHEHGLMEKFMAATDLQGNLACILARMMKDNGVKLAGRDYLKPPEMPGFNIEKIGLPGDEKAPKGRSLN